MSADNWEDCPVCKEKNCVRIDGLYDYELEEDGTITTEYLRGKCGECGKGYGKYKGQDEKKVV